MKKPCQVALFTHTAPPLGLKVSPGARVTARLRAIRLGADAFQLVPTTTSRLYQTRTFGYAATATGDLAAALRKDLVASLSMRTYHTLKSAEQLHTDACLLIRRGGYEVYS